MRRPRGSNGWNGAIPIWARSRRRSIDGTRCEARAPGGAPRRLDPFGGGARHLRVPAGDRKSTRLNSSHLVISYAVFCLKKKKNNIQSAPSTTLDVMHYLL